MNMCLLKGLLLVTAAPLCSSFVVPLVRPSVSSPKLQHTLNKASPDDSNNTHKSQLIENNAVLEGVGKAAGVALLALTLSFSAISTAPFDTVPPANAFSAVPSVTLASTSSSGADDPIVKSLEKETREAEKEAKKAARKAAVEKSRENFFEYEAKTAEEQEARIEAAERKAELEAETDKKLVAELQAREEKAEQEAALATSKAEKAAKQKEAKALLAKEKEVLRKERKAERAERVFLAEEEQEQKIVKQKEEAARQEEQKYEAVEKKYEAVAELAKEDELELSLAKKMLKK